jgi:hypothetical protein
MVNPKIKGTPKELWREWVDSGMNTQMFCKKYNVLESDIEYVLNIAKSKAYFYSERHNAHFGVSIFELKENGDYSHGLTTGFFSKEEMEENGVPFKGISRH